MSEPDYKSFALDIINSTFKHYVDNFVVQELAVKYGIIVRTGYDHNRHGENDVDAVDGDDWYEFVE